MLQEQSSFGPSRYVDGRLTINNPDEYHDAVRELARAAKAAGADVVLYATWPRRDQPDDLAALHNAAVKIAVETGADVAPVGLVWHTLLDNHPDSELYGTDGSHPSRLGTYVAAATIARAVRGIVPEPWAVREVAESDGWGKVGEATYDFHPPAELVPVLPGIIEDIYQQRFTGRPQTPRPLPPEATMSAPDIDPRSIAGTWRGEMPAFSADSITAVELEISEIEGALSGRLALATRPAAGIADDDGIAATLSIGNGVLRVECKNLARKLRRNVPRGPNT